MEDSNLMDGTKPINETKMNNRVRAGGLSKMMFMLSLLEIYMDTRKSKSSTIPTTGLLMKTAFLFEIKLIAHLLIPYVFPVMPKR
jgi:hypothetical protein